MWSTSPGSDSDPADPVVITAEPADIGLEAEDG